jgi:hypothetical protein
LLVMIHSRQRFAIDLEGEKWEGNRCEMHHVQAAHIESQKNITDRKGGVSTIS